MASIGTLAWAIGMVEDVRRIFGILKDEAEGRQLSVRQSAGRENLAELMRYLEEPIAVLRRSKSSRMEKKLEEALDLYEEINDSVYG